MKIEFTGRNFSVSPAIRNMLPIISESWILCSMARLELTSS